ncbi:unnamed protein product, partial [Arabidopsis halleri]
LLKGFVLDLVISTSATRNHFSQILFIFFLCLTYFSSILSLTKHLHDEHRS